MTEKIAPIRNPLTVIAIFAGIAEISGTGVLPFIAEANQLIFVWFLILFPTLIVIFFFLTLNFNHKVLYAPSDFKNEENFFRNASKKEVAEKVREELVELDDSNAEQRSIKEPEGKAYGEGPQNTESNQSQPMTQERYLTLEENIINKVEMELGGPLRREVRFESTEHFVFDGMTVKGWKIIAVEAFYARSGAHARFKARRLLDRVEKVVNGMQTEMRSRFELYIAIALEDTRLESIETLNSLISLTNRAPFPVQIKLFNRQELEL